MIPIVPKQIFFTKGVGFHRNKLQSFESALRDAGIEICNLVTVSSIFPPECQIIPRAKGAKEARTRANHFRCSCPRGDPGAEPFAFCVGGPCAP